MVNLPPAKAALANEQLKSRFVSMLTGAFRKGVEETPVLEAKT
jgi:hypothetical protein